MAPDEVHPATYDAPARAVLPVGLAYDELPPGSDVRREYGPEGSVTITAPAGEPSAAALRAAAQRTGLLGAVTCAVPFGLLVWVSLSLSDSVRRLDTTWRIVAALLFGVFFGGVFLLVWSVTYALRVQALSEARREAVVLHADARRLLVEAAGPLGNQSFDVPAGDVLSIDVGRELLATSARVTESVPCLRVTLADGRVLTLMPGRNEAELRWVAAAVGQALGTAAH